MGERMSPRRAVISVALATVFTALLWTLITGDLGQGALYGAVALVVMLGWVALDRRRGDR
jgi:mannose/fructose/N-acetylgalactosamine-specific phosphotransferase system component IIC